MGEWIDYFKSINIFHWGTGFYQYLFYAGILLILALEKKKAAKYSLALWPILFLAGIFNPLFYEVLNRVFVGYNAPYYARMFSFLPLFVCTAAGFTLLATKFRSFLRLAMVCIISAAFVLLGNSIYHQYWMERATNPG